MNGGKKKKFTGSRVPFPPLDERMQIPLLLAKMPAQSTLELDQFNGRWKASWKTPVTNEWKRLSRSWGFNRAGDEPNQSGLAGLKQKFD